MRSLHRSKNVPKETKKCTTWTRPVQYFKTRTRTHAEPQNTHPELIRKQLFDIARPEPGQETESPEISADENHHSRRTELKAETMISI